MMYNYINGVPLALFTAMFGAYARLQFSILRRGRNMFIRSSQTYRVVVSYSLGDLRPSGGFTHFVSCDVPRRSNRTHCNAKHNRESTAWKISRSYTWLGSSRSRAQHDEMVMDFRRHSDFGSAIATLGL